MYYSDVCMFLILWCKHFITPILNIFIVKILLTDWTSVQDYKLTAQQKAETQPHLQCRIQAEQQNFWESQGSVAVWCCANNEERNMAVTSQFITDFEIK